MLQLLKLLISENRQVNFLAIIVPLNSPFETVQFPISVCETIENHNS